MKNSKYYFHFGFIMFLSLFVSLSLFAQHGRGHYEQYHKHYNYYPRTHVYVNYGHPYYYHPYYRPRPIYRPVYTSPYAYMHFGPAFGIRINLLPVGYSRIYVGSVPYYYSQGVYYRSYSNGGYKVIAPPLGASVSQLPHDARVTVIDGQKYYQLGGTFYQEEILKNNRLSYRVVGTDGVINTGNSDQEDLTGNNNEAPAMGSRYDELPSGCKVEVVNQHKYFISADGTYYQEVIEGDKVRYEVTAID